MTPILRRSKESARRQRSRPESERSQDIPNTRPLAERARPTLPNRKRPFQRYYYSLRPEGAENIPLGSQVSDLCFYNQNCIRNPKMGSKQSITGAPQ